VLVTVAARLRDQKTNKCAMQDRKAFPLCIKSCCQFLIGTHLLPFPTVGTAMADFYRSTSLLLFLEACENTLQQHSSLLASFRDCCRCFSMLFGFDCFWSSWQLCSLFYSRQAHRSRGGLELWIAIPANKWRRVYTWGSFWLEIIWLYAPTDLPGAMCEPFCWCSNLS
jgi:hypothetical protein